MVEKQSIKRLSNIYDLFDPDFQSEAIFLRSRVPIACDPEVMYDSNNLLRGNKRYIRDFTMHQASERKTGGLVIKGDCCYYKENYILPGAVLYVMDVGNIEMVDFKDLVVYAIRHESPYSDDDFHLAVFFRCLRTGDFFVISYYYSDFYISEESDSSEYFRYYAYCFSSSVEAEIHKLSVEGELALYNTVE
ncbi:hypothetical protein [Sabulibacter ruber]|uniref:hypothetical protein n=1 Tax=Sabulibacter ruber TaxID=2811901 RepID=UPI001A97102B|nr:hypothetical protein [Sabulibacter ruber]